MLNKLRQFWQRKTKTRLVGLDIGSGALKLAEVSWRQNRPTVQSLGMVELSPATLQQEMPADHQELVDKLRQLLATTQTSCRDVVMALGGRAVFAREITMPVMSDEELREAIKWDLDKYVPQDPEQYYFDFAVIGPGKNELEIKVLLVAAPRETIEKLVAVVKSAGLKPLAVEIEPLALYRTLAGADNSLVIDIGALVSQITVFQKGTPAVTRTIGISGYRFTEVLMRVLELELTEAERFKRRQQGLLRAVGAGNEQSQLHRQLGLLVDELAREIRRTVEYYQLQNKEAVIERMFVTGGGARLDNLTNHLAAQLDIPVVIHNPFASVEVDAVYDKEYLDELGGSYAVAVGLALRGGQP